MALKKRVFEIVGFGERKDESKLGGAVGIQNRIDSVSFHIIFSPS